MVVHAPAADDIDMAFPPVQRAGIGQRASAETLVTAALIVVDARAAQRQRGTAGNGQIAGQCAAYPVAAAGQRRRAAACKGAAVPRIAAEQRVAGERESAAALAERSDLQRGKGAYLRTAGHLQIGDGRCAVHGETRSVLHAHGEGRIGEWCRRAGRRNHGRFNEFEATAAVELASGFNRIACAAAEACGGACRDIHHPGNGCAARGGERTAVDGQGRALLDVQNLVGAGRAAGTGRVVER